MLLIVFLPISILESIINGRMLNAYTVFQQIAQAGVSLSNEADFFQAAYQVLFHSGLTLLVGLFLQPVGTIAIAKVVKQFVTKQEISFGTALGEAFSLMPTIVFSGVIYGVLIFLTSLIIVPGIYLSVAWVFYVYAIGLSDKKGMEPMRYSKALVKGKWWRTFGYLLLLAVIAMLWNSAFQLSYSFFPNGKNWECGVSVPVLFLCCVCNGRGGTAVFKQRGSDIRHTGRACGGGCACGIRYRDGRGRAHGKRRK